MYTYNSLCHARVLWFTAKLPTSCITVTSTVSNPYACMLSGWQVSWKSMYAHISLCRAHARVQYLLFINCRFVDFWANKWLFRCLTLKKNELPPSFIPDHIYVRTFIYIKKRIWSCRFLQQIFFWLLCHVISQWIPSHACTSIYPRSNGQTWLKFDTISLSRRYCCSVFLF